MLIIDKKLLLFKSQDIHFAEHPFDVDGCDAVTFIDCKEPVDNTGFMCVKQLTSVIDLTEDLEILFGNISKNNRKQIRHAEKEGIKISMNQHYDEFFQIYKRFQKRKGFGTMFERMIVSTKLMRMYGTLFTVEHEGVILGGRLCLQDKNSIKAWVSASKRLDADDQTIKIVSRANRLLHWEVMKHAKQKGIQEYDLGGMWPPEEAAQDKMKHNINSFKLGFGSRTVTRYRCKKAYSKAYRLAQFLHVIPTLESKNEEAA